MISIETGAALFVAGMAAGVALHRLIMAMVLEKAPDDICAYCEWLGQKSRHKNDGSSKKKSTCYPEELEIRVGGYDAEIFREGLKAFRKATDDKREDSEA